jgi:hypothetical protein
MFLRLGEAAAGAHLRASSAMPAVGLISKPTRAMLAPVPAAKAYDSLS